MSLHAAPQLVSPTLQGEVKTSAVASTFASDPPSLSAMGPPAFVLLHPTDITPNPANVAARTTMGRHHERLRSNNSLLM